jgi:hypothetical protein
MKNEESSRRTTGLVIILSFIGIVAEPTHDRNIKMCGSKWEEGNDHALTKMEH